jgi:DNA adenine methylase
MRYLGGKSRIARKLAARIREIVPDAEVYWDPFCGGLSMSVALSEYAPVLASDACAPLIALYRAVRGGWVPPSDVSEDEWRSAKALPDTDPFKAFAGFGCSFGGRWFEGYARAKQDTRPGRTADPSLARMSSQGLRRDVHRVADLECVDWLAWPPCDFGGVLYLDPPYAGTKPFSGMPAFDADAFRSRVRSWSEHVPVFVSEYAFSLGECVWEKPLAKKVAGGADGGGRVGVERLYYIAKGSL